jgi:tetratricopeptide (TPR) repeat protein
MKRLLIDLVLVLVPAVPAAAALVFDSDGDRLFAAGHFARAAQAYCESVARLESAYDPDPDAIASTLFNLAAAERAIGQVRQAADHYIRSIAIREQSSGPDDPSIGHPLAGLALIYQSEGRTAEGMRLAERAVRVSSSDPGNWRLYADVRNTLSTMLLSEGQNANAAALAADVAAELELAGRADTRDYLAALTNLGTAYLRSKQFDEAETALRRAEAAALEIVGPRHRLTATVWNNLGQVQSAKGNAKGAEALLRSAIDAWRETPGAESDLSRGLTNLGALYQSRRRYSDAERMFRQAMEIDSSLFGDDSLRVASDRNSLGGLFAAQHRYELAAGMLEKALAAAEQRVGAGHPSSAAIAVNLASVYVAEGKYHSATVLFARAVPVEQRILGPNSPELASILRLQAQASSRIALASPRAD